MLASLSIRDIVLIERLDLSLAGGLSVLTGETGAGKSILLDALGLALGARAEGGLIRPGATAASVAAVFEPPAGHRALALIAEQGLEAEAEVVLRRQIGADGRSRAFINDQPVSAALLRRVGDALVEIEGQFEQQGLKDPSTHRGWLDAYGGLSATAARTAQAWQAWRAKAEARATAAAEIERAAREEAFLRHSAEELRQLAPKPGEEAALAETRALLMNREQILEAMAAAHTELSGDSGAETRLTAAARRLGRIAEKAGAAVQPIVEALDRAGAEAAEAVRLLQAASDDLEADPGRLEQVDTRLFALRDAARKHGVEVEALPPLAQQMAERLAALDARGDVLARLTAEEAAARDAYVVAAETLGRERGKAAARLDKAVNAELPPLKLEKAKFRTRLDRLEESDWGETGLDRVAFEVTTNPGMPPGPLARIASGGELSRFMLALRVALAAADPVPTLVFDEVDSGIGGATAAAVGERLARLAERVQVLVVTHSPQVAARGRWHWRVEKAAARKGAAAVTTNVEALEEAGRREEIARMLSGATVTDEARAAADQLLAGSRAPSARAAAR
jgi:DNA repair protein RecN (Recombination protein N)